MGRSQKPSAVLIPKELNPWIRQQINGLGDARPWHWPLHGAKLQIRGNPNVVHIQRKKQSNEAWLAIGRNRNRNKVRVDKGRGETRETRTRGLHLATWTLHDTYRYPAPPTRALELVGSKSEAVLGENLHSENFRCLARDGFPVQ